MVWQEVTLIDGYHWRRVRIVFVQHFDDAAAAAAHGIDNSDAAAAVGVPCVGYFVRPDAVPVATAHFDVDENAYSTIATDSCRPLHSQPPVSMSFDGFSTWLAHSTMYKPFLKPKTRTVDLSISIFFINLSMLTVQSHELLTLLTLGNQMQTHESLRTPI